MKEMNDLIIKRVKKARIERNLTQKVLADYLGRTAASISDLERGKVQVSASDLYKISQLLTKPVEYFFGEDFGGEKIEDLVSFLRTQPPEYRNATIDYVKKLMELRSIGNEIINTPEKEDVPVEKLKRFLELLVEINNQGSEASNKVDQATKLVLEGIEFKGIDTEEFIQKLRSE